MLNRYLTDTNQYVDLTTTFKMRPCIIGEVRRLFAISLFLALIWKFIAKFGNINSIFHLDRIPADSKY